MPFHHLAAWLLQAVIPLIVCCVLYVILRRRTGILASGLYSLAGLVLSLVLFHKPISTCTDSYDALLAARKLLTPAELATLEGTDFICPTLYNFQRNGEFVCFVTDNDGGGHVGCE